MVAKISSRTTGNATVKKTEAGLRQNAFWSYRNWCAKNASPLIAGPSGALYPGIGVERRTGSSSVGLFGLGGEREVDVLQVRAGYFQALQLQALLGRPPGQRMQVGDRVRRLHRYLLAVEAVADRRRQAVAVAEVLGRAAGDYLAARDDRHPVGETLRLVHVVGGEEDGLAEVAQTGDRIPGVAAGGGVEAGGRLVEEEQLGVADQGHADVETALLATREAARAGIGLAAQADQLDHLVDRPRRAVVAGIEPE